MCLQSVSVYSVSDVSEVHSVSIFIVEICRVGEFLRVCMFIFRKTQEGRKSRAGVPSAPIATVCWQSSERKETAILMSCPVSNLIGDCFGTPIADGFSCIRWPLKWQFLSFHKSPGPQSHWPGRGTSSQLFPLVFRNISLCRHKKSHTLHSSTLKVEEACSSTSETSAHCSLPQSLNTEK